MHTVHAPCITRPFQLKKNHTTALVNKSVPLGPFNHLKQKCMGAPKVTTATRMGHLKPLKRVIFLGASLRTERTMSDKNPGSLEPQLLGGKNGNPSASLRETKPLKDAQKARKS